MQLPRSQSRLSRSGVLWAIVLVATTLLASSCRETGSGESPSALGGVDTASAPEFTLPDLDGQLVRLADFQGKVLLLDFWATWCGPCRMEIPHFKQLTEKYGSRGFIVVGVAMDEKGAEVVRPFVTENGISYRVVIGDAYTARRYGGVQALPTTFLIDRNGHLVKKYVGYRDLETFEEDITPLL